MDAEPKYCAVIRKKIGKLPKLAAYITSLQYFPTLMTIHKP